MASLIMNSGSYEYDSFQDRSEELGRLSEQAHHFVDLERRLLSELGVAQAGHILEIGCGPGFVTRLLQAVAPQSEIIAVDQSFELLRQLPANPPGEASGTVWPIQSSGERLPVPDDWAHFAYARFLLQHVPDPLSITLEARRTLMPGGIFCIADSDDGLVLQYPENDRLSQLLRDADRSQRDAGGDRFVGRKLQQILHDAGFVDIRSRIVGITSSDAPVAVLLKMALGYKAALTGQQDTLAKIIAETAESAAKGQYFFATGVVVAIGRNPAS